MNNNSKNNTQTKLTLVEKIEDIFNVNTKEKKENLHRCAHTGFLIVLMSILVAVGLYTSNSKQQIQDENSERVQGSIEVDNVIEQAEEPKVMTVDMAVISLYGVNIRREPNTDSDIIGVLYYGNRIDVIDTDDEETEWLKMSAGGYVNKKYLEVYDPEKDYSFPDEFLEELRKQQEEELRKQQEELQQSRAIASRGGELPVISSSNNYAYYNDCVNSSSGLSELDIYNLLREKAPNMAHVASDVIQIERDYGINALFTISVASHESGWARSELATYNNNIFGLKNSRRGGWYSFSDKSESVYLFAKSIYEIYFSNGLVTPESINEVYCPNDNGYWSTQVESIMREYINLHNSKL